MGDETCPLHERSSMSQARTICFRQICLSAVPQASAKPSRRLASNGGGERPSASFRRIRKRSRKVGEKFRRRRVCSLSGLFSAQDRNRTSDPVSLTSSPAKLWLRRSDWAGRAGAGRGAGGS